MKFCKVVSVIVCLILLVSCSNFKRNSLGPENLICVLADKDTYEIYRNQLENIFHDPIFTPIVENRYELKRVDKKEFGKKSRFHNIIMLTDVDSNSDESKFINEMFTDSLRQGVREGKYLYFFQKDIWAKKQNVLFLMDSKNFLLDDYLNKNKEKIFNYINDRNLDIIKSRLFDNFNDAELEKDVRKNRNIKLFIPHDFVLINEGKNVEFLRFRRRYPDRWLTIIKGDYNSEFSFQENVIKLRDEAGREFGDSVRVNPERIIFQEDTTFEQNGIKVKGIWEYELGGGPFFTYAFLRKNRLYLIDGAVYAPEKERKYPFINQLDLMAKTVEFFD